MPKNKLIKKALQIYLTQLNKAEYVRSYKKMVNDSDMLQIAEEDIGDFSDPTITAPPPAKILF